MLFDVPFLNKLILFLLFFFFSNHPITFSNRSLFELDFDIDFYSIYLRRLSIEIPNFLRRKPSHRMQISLQRTIYFPFISGMNFSSPHTGRLISSNTTLISFNFLGGKSGFLTNGGKSWNFFFGKATCFFGFPLVVASRPFLERSNVILSFLERDILFYSSKG